MIHLSDLAKLGKLYPPGRLDDPTYAVAGGSAVLCWANEAHNGREYRDIDLFAFAPERLITGTDLLPVFIGGFTSDGIVSESSPAPVELQIVQKSYFHAELIPTIADVRQLSIHGVPLLVLSPEFLVVSKLSFPNVHRYWDFSDVLTLCQQGHLQNVNYLASLLTKTSLSEFITAQDILQIKTWEDLQLLVLSVQRQLIRQFLHWPAINVEILDPFQIFVVLDIANEVFASPSENTKFVDFHVSGMAFSRKRLQLAKLAIYLLLIGIPEKHAHELIQNQEFQQMIMHLVLKDPNIWLPYAKTVFLTLKQIARVESLVGSKCESIWQPGILLGLIERIFFKDASIFSLLACCQSLLFDLSKANAPASDCDRIVSKKLGIVRSLENPNPSTYKAYPWIFAKRKVNNYPNHSKEGGKWLLVVPIEEADEIWERIADEVEQGQLGSLAKVSTAFDRPDQDNLNQRVICVYTYSWKDRQDAMRIRKRLDQLGFTGQISYKTDRATP